MTIQKLRLYLTLLLIFTAQVLFAQVTADLQATTTEGCSPLVVSFSDQSTGNPTNWRWDFGNGNGSIQQNPSAIYLNPGVYTVSLIASNAGERDTVIRTQYITVWEDPTPSLTSDVTSGCIPATVNFTDQSTEGDTTIVSWLWDFGDGSTSTQVSPSHTYTNPGVYTITLLVRDANGCSDELSIDDMITITNAPDAQFTANPNNACFAPQTISFNNTSTGNGLTYAWDFGDGSTSTDSDPTHTYTSTGAYTVSLTITNNIGCTDVLTIPNYINIFDFEADFNASSFNACENEPIQFTDASSPSPWFWQWDFGDGNTSNFQSPIHSYANAGTYTVRLIATNISGCTDTLEIVDMIEVTPAPIVEFTADTLEACSAPLTVNFTDTTASAVSWDWDFGDGSTSTQQNPTYTYNSPGSYDVSLTVTNANGCASTDTLVDMIQITEPDPDIDADVRQGCIPLTVNFTDQSTTADPIVSWFWDFGDGNTSTQQNPTNTFVNPDMYDITLTVTTASGCVVTETFNNYIAAGDVPTVEFAGTPLQTCLFFPVTFTDTAAVSGNYWYWDFGDGTNSLDQNPTHQYADTGLFNVTLIVGDNGCFDTLVKPGYVQIFPPEANFNVSYNCVDPYTVDFTDNSVGGHIWHWDFGDGDTSNLQDPTHTYPSRGSYGVTLTVYDTLGGCFDIATQTINITDPIADFVGDDLSGCARHRVNFTASASTDAVSYSWLMGDGTTRNTENPSKLYSNPGTYTVTLIVTDIHGCTDTIVKPDYITVYAATADFIADTFSGCAPLAVTYQDSSSSYLGTVTSWNWDLGNGDVSTLQNPSAIYNTPGTYSVGLTIEDSNGCRDTIEKINYIIPTYPTPDFSAVDTVVCLGSPVVFQNNSIGSSMSYIWDLGDSTNSTDAAPIHTYADTGYYTVSLYVLDVNGCDSMIVKPNYIQVVQPTGNFTVDTLVANCPPLLVNFTDLSDSSIVAWEYNFGDGQTSNLQNPSHIYNRPGVFHPSLIVTNSIGCTDTILLPDSIVITGPWGSFDFNQQTVCAPFDIEFYAIDTDSNTLHIWDFGDGDVSVDDDTTTHTYADPGLFNPVMILDDQMGCIVSIPSPRPILATIIEADFIGTPDIVCQEGDVYFFDQSTGVPDVVAWEWHFGDGDTSHQQDPIHHYSGAGTYDVTLISTNANGCMDTIVKPDFIVIYPAPVADFSVSEQTVCFPTLISYTDLSTADTTIVAWAWDFGDGNTSTQQNPTHTYGAAGVYTTTLVITNVRGCSDTSSLDITVKQPPIALANPDVTICIGDTAQLTGTGGIIQRWDANNTLSDTTIANPLTFPTSNTSYYLTVTDSNGCQGRDTVIVFVNPLPTPTANPTRTICIGESANLSANGGISFAWSPTGDLDDAFSRTPVATPLATTTYTVTVTDANGCSNTTTTQVIVNPLPITDIIPAQQICRGDSIGLWATGGVSYIWRPAGTLIGPNQATPLAFPNGSTNYIVTVTDANGCRANDTTQVIVNPLPTAIVTPDQAICPGETAQLNASGGVSYQWMTDPSLSCTNCADPIASPAATTTYTVVVTNSFGCTDTNTTTVAVNPLPNAVANPTRTICIGESANLSASGGVSYAWSPAGDLDDAFVSNPVATPTVTTTYTVTVTDTNGCTNSTTTQVVVNPLPITDIVPTQQICRGDSIGLWATGGTSYIWRPAGTLIGPNQASPLAFPNGTTNYIVTVTDINGCRANDTTQVIVNPLPTAIVSPDQDICPGETAQLNASGGVSYLWMADPSLSCTNCADPIASPAATTTYTVIVTNSFGCTDTNTTTVTVNPLPSVVISNDTLLCTGEYTQLFVSGGVSYQWTADPTLSCTTCADPIARPSINTTYYVEVTNQFGCVSTDSVRVDFNDVTAAIGASDTSSCLPAVINFSDLSTADSTIVAWSWNFGDGNTSSAQNPSNTYNTPGVYTVTLEVTTNTSCTDVAQLDVTVWELPSPDAGPDNTICVEDTTTLSATGGVSYLWNNASSLSDPNVASPSAFPTADTWYTVLVTDSNGCQAEDSTFVKVNPLPNVTIVADSQTCNNVAIQLEASGGVDYLWSPAASLTDPNIYNPIARPFFPTTYTVTVTDTNGCVNMEDAYIRVLFAPVPVMGNDTTICLGNSVQLSVGGGDDYLWHADTTLSCLTCTDPIATPTSTRYYYVDVRNIDGCTTTDSVLVTVNALPNIAVSNDTLVCDRSEVGLFASGGDFFQWSSTEAIDCDSCNYITSTPQVDADYMVTVSTAAGCSLTDTVHVDVTQIDADFAISDSLLCTPAEIQFTDLSVTDSTIATWAWSLGNGDTASTQNTSTTYNNGGTFNVSLVVTDNIGCMDSITKPLTMLQTPTADAGLDTAICIGSDAKLIGSGGGTYLWSNGATLSDSTMATSIAQPTSTTNYVLTVTSANGCTDTDSVTITVNALPVAQVIDDIETCSNDSIQLVADGGDSYLWSPSIGLNDPTLQSPMAYTDSTIVYIVQITDTNGCSAIDSVSLKVNPIPEPVLNVPTDICEGDSAEVTASGGVAYVWTPQADFECETCPSTTVRPSETTTYTITVFSDMNCVAEDTFTINVRPTPTVNTIDDEKICKHTIVELTTESTDADAFVWTPVSGLSSDLVESPTAVPNSSTQYIVTATNQYGCIDRDTVNIEVIEQISALVSNNAAICDGDRIELSVDITEDGIDNTTVTWLNIPGNRPNRNDQTVSPNETTTYQVVVSGGTCVPDTHSITVAVNPNPQPNLGPDLYSVAGQQLSLNSGLEIAMDRYDWGPTTGLDCFDCEEVYFIAENDITYTLSVTDENGCTGSDDVNIKVIASCADDLFVPNSFSPNRDGKNDVLYVRGNKLSGIKIFRIFDRWGNLVFETNDVDHGWNGVYNGKMVDPGVFVYYVEALCDEGGEVFKKGNVTVLR